MSVAACLEAVFRRVGGLAASLLRAGGRLSCSMSMRVSCAFGFERMGGMEATVSRVGEMTCSFGLICRTSVGDDWPLWASDQVVLTIDGGKVYVTKTT